MARRERSNVRSAEANGAHEERLTERGHRYNAVEELGSKQPVTGYGLQEAA